MTYGISCSACGMPDPEDGHDCCSPLEVLMEVALLAAVVCGLMTVAWWDLRWLLTVEW